MPTSRLGLFRAIALVEGVTTIALFLIAMPLKYWAGNPVLVPPVGMAHGVAWIGYVVAMAVCLPGRGFSLWEWLRTFVAALFPFGTFLNDGLVRRKMAARVTA
jgi:integral membrane protein